MLRISLREHQTTAAIALSPDQIDALRNAPLDLVIQPSVGRPGHADIRAGSRVGIAVVGEMVVEIAPKIPIRNVLFMASYAEDPQCWRDDPLPFEEEPTLVEAIVPGFLLALERALGPGVLNGYREVEDALQGVRGRIRFDEQLRRRMGRVPPVELRYEEFSEDTDANRLLKAAIARLRWLRITSEDQRHRLRRWHGTLERVPVVEYDPRALPDVRFSRLNEHYRWAVTLAKQILRGSAFELHQGEVLGTSILLDLNQIFEDFVANALERALIGRPEAFSRSVRGRSLHLDQDRSIRLEPDISLWDGGRCVFVGDIKYKAMQDDAARQADLYQLLAYTVGAGVGGGMLIYAEGPRGAVAHRVGQPEKSLNVSALDLTVPPAALLRQMDVLADRVIKVRHFGAQDQRFCLA